jgi:hypothetical protein
MKTRSSAITALLIAITLTLVMLSGGPLSVVRAQAPSQSPTPAPQPTQEHLPRINSPSCSNNVCTVYANVQWVNTGINLNVGDQLTITATGSWAPGLPEPGFVGPDGSSIQWPDNFLNLTDIGVCAYCAHTNTPHWAGLIGYIGSAPPPAGSYTSPSILSEAQKVFFVGSNYSGNAADAGTLWLNFNDDAYSNVTFDNSGQVTATVTVGSGNGGCTLPNFGNPLFDQLDYNATPYGGKYVNGVLIPFKYNTVRGKGTDTIADWGCNLVSGVMLINNYAAQLGVIDPNTGKTFQTDPNTLNDWLQRNGGYETGQILTNQLIGQYYDKSFVIQQDIAYYASLHGVHFTFEKSLFGENTQNNMALNGHLCALNPVELAVNSGGHWVDASGQSVVNNTNTWQIVDPDPLLNAMKSAFTTLYQGYGNQYASMNLFESGGPGNSLTVFSDPVPFLIIDSQGRETGFDPTTQNTVTQIPNSSYGDEFLASDTSGGITQQTVFNVASAANGTYTLEVIGSGANYLLDIVPYDSQGLGGTPVSISGPSALGVIDTYLVAYSPTPGQPMNVQREVNIDIKPGEDPPAINPNSNGVTPVAILSTTTFDATTIDPTSVKFGPNGASAVHSSIEDVDGNGSPDLMLQFTTKQTGIKAGDTQACLTGTTINGLNIVGCDTIRTVP